MPAADWYQAQAHAPSQTVSRPARAHMHACVLCAKPVASPWSGGGGSFHWQVDPLTGGRGGEGGGGQPFIGRWTHRRGGEGRGEEVSLSLAGGPIDRGGEEVSLCVYVYLFCRPILAQSHGKKMSQMYWGGVPPNPQPPTPPQPTGLCMYVPYMHSVPHRIHILYRTCTLSLTVYTRTVPYMHSVPDHMLSLITGCVLQLV